MDEKQLSEIEERLAKASAGPWEIGRQSPNGLNNVGTLEGMLTAQTIDEENANLIANAPTDISDLCAALRTEKKQAAEWEPEYVQMRNNYLRLRGIVFKRLEGYGMDAGDTAQDIIAEYELITRRRRR